MQWDKDDNNYCVAEMKVIIIIVVINIIIITIDMEKW